MRCGGKIRASTARPLARIDRQIDAAEVVSVGESLDDGDARDPVGHPLVGVTGDDGVDHGAARRQLARHLKNLAVGLAGVEVLGGVEALADAAGMSGHDDDGRASPMELGDGSGDGGGQRLDRQSGEVGGQRRARRAGGGDADDADLDPRHAEQDIGDDILPGGRPAGRRVDQVGVEEREGCLRRPRAQRPARIVAGRLARLLGHDRRADGTEVELVVPERGGGVAEGVVGADDGGPLGQIGGERPLEHVARVDEQHGAAIAGAGAAQVGEVAAQRGQRLDPAVQVIGADQRDRHARWRRGRRGRREGTGRACTAERRRQRSPPPGSQRSRFRVFPNGRSWSFESSASRTAVFFTESSSGTVRSFAGGGARERCDQDAVLIHRVERPALGSGTLQRGARLDRQLRWAIAGRVPGDGDIEVALGSQQQRPLHGPQLHPARQRRLPRGNSSTALDSTSTPS